MNDDICETDEIIFTKKIIKDVHRNIEYKKYRCNTYLYKKLMCFKMMKEAL